MTAQPGPPPLPMNPPGTARSQLAAALVRTGTGDRAALRTVYNDSSAKIFGILMRLLKDRGAAEEVLQDVYVTVWRKAALFDPERASAIAWLIAIARNRAIDRLRAGFGRYPAVAPEQAEAAPGASPAVLDMVVTAEQQARLGACLGQLDEKASQALRSAFLDGMTYDQLAERMTVPPDTARSWIKRGLLKLRTCLDTP